MQLAPRQLDLFGRLSRPPVSAPPRAEEAPPKLEVVPVPNLPRGASSPLPQVAERPPTRQETLARARALAGQIADLLGHRQISMTHRYSHLAASHRSALVGRVMGDLR